MGLEYINNIINNLNEIPDKSLKLEYLLDIGEELEEYPKNEETPENLVNGCASKTYISYACENSKLYFKGESDSLFGKSYIVILINTFNGLTASELIENSLTIEEKFNSEISDLKMISSRMNSFSNIFKHIVNIAKSEL